MYQVPPARAWYATLFLMLLYSISYVDRYALSLLAAPISAMLHIPDVEMGLLFGAGFGVMYSLTGLPLAHVIDRYKRVPIVAGGVILWTASTLASGFASGFPALLLCRSGVAIGEAVLSPAAISIIGDLFTREKRTFPTSLYVAIAGFMQAGAFVVCGFTIDLANSVAKVVPLAPWRLTLILLGSSGIVLGVLFYCTLREPARSNETGNFGSAREAAGYFWQERALFGWMFIGMAAMGASGAAFLAWTPTLLIRAFHESTAYAGYLFGTVGTGAALFSAFCWPALVAAGARLGYRSAPVMLLAAGLGIAIISIAVAGTTSSITVMMVAVGLAMFGVGASGILPPLIIQYVSPSRMRGRLVAVNFMASSLIGLPLGPPLAAAIAESFYSGSHAIGYAMTAIAAACAPVAILAILLSRHRFIMALDCAIRRESSPENHTHPPAARESLRAEARGAREKADRSVP